MHDFIVCMCIDDFSDCNICSGLKPHCRFCFTSNPTPSFCHHHIQHLRLPPNITSQKEISLMSCVYPKDTSVLLSKQLAGVDCSEIRHNWAAVCSYNVFNHVNIKTWNAAELNRSFKVFFVSSLYMCHAFIVV